jgi:AraC-like DNA-binding protein
MAIYMDIHEVPGAQALDLAEAHRKDILIQDEYRCKCMTYWLDESRGNAFCLIEAPDRSVVEEMHRKSHGFIPHKIIEVQNEVIESFLGRIHDPQKTELSLSGLKVFSESAFRILLVIEKTDPILLEDKLGTQKARDLHRKITSLIKRISTAHGGREAEHTGTGFIVSFAQAVKAVECALSIQKDLSTIDRKTSGIRMGISAGDPVSKSDEVFGDTIRLGKSLCTVKHGNSQVVVSTIVQKLLASNFFQKNRKDIFTLSAQDESFLESVFDKLEERWKDSDFNVLSFCQSLSMSKSQLYRKTVALWDLSPNLLLKEFRLEKARELLRTQSYNISQATFDSGFTSPSYFTKCFKKKFGLLPANYLNSPH